MIGDADTIRVWMTRDNALFRMRRILDTPEHRARLAPGTVDRFQALIDRYAGDACHTLSDTEQGHLREAERALGILSNRWTAVTPRRRGAMNRAALGHDLPDDRKLPPWLMGERPPTFPEWLKVRGYVLALMSFLRAATPG